MLALGFRPRTGSKVLFERVLDRGLVEYAVWCCHQGHDAFHIQWGMRHALCDAYYGNEFEYARQDYVGVFPYGSESQLDIEIEKSLGVYEQHRSRMLSEMERYLRTQEEAKRNLIRWHEWHCEFAAVGAQKVEDFRRHFQDVPTTVSEAACKFMKDVEKSVRLRPERALWRCFAMLKEYQSNPMGFDGNWWSLHGRVGWAGSFYNHLGDLDALLEPYDV
jgi:hypothetical protein